jgi:hypothetical protein
MISSLHFSRIGPDTVKLLASMASLTHSIDTAPEELYMANEKGKKMAPEALTQTEVDALRNVQCRFRE